MKSAPLPGPTDELDIRVGDGFCLVRVRVTPKASRNEVIGVAAGCLRLRIQAPPVEGAANEKARDFLAGLLGLPRRDVVLEKGQTAREKVFRIMGMSAADIKAKVI